MLENARIWNMGLMGNEGLGIPLGSGGPTPRMERWVRGGDQVLLSIMREGKLRSSFDVKPVA